MVRFREILKALQDQGLDFVVIGGVAASLHGSPVGTTDVDVCISFSDENLPKIIAAMRPLHPRLRHRPDRMPLPEDIERLRGLKNLYLDTDLGKVDLLGELPGICTYEELAGRTVIKHLEGLACRVLDLDTLIKAKQHAGRDKDHSNVMHLQAIKKMLEQNPGLFDDLKP